MYTIDFTRVSEIPKFSVSVKKGDSKRTISLILLENNKIINLNDYTVTVAAKKSDGTDIFNDVKIIDAESGVCEVEITKQMLVLDTDLPCEIILYGADGTVASSSNFVISKIDSIRDEESIVSSSEFTALINALSKVQGIDDRFKKIEDKQTIIGVDLSSANISNRAWIKVLDDEGGVKKAQYNIANENEYDTYHFETSEDLIVNAIKNVNGNTGYRKLPDGLIIQWGYITNIGTSYSDVLLPIAYSNNDYNIQLTAYWQNDFVAVCAGECYANRFRLACKNITSQGNEAGNVFWMTIGY